MTITLRPELEIIVRRAIESGAYQTPDQVVEHAIEALDLDEDSVDQKIQRAMEQFDRGESLTPDLLKAAMTQRKAAWLAAQPTR